MIIEGGFRLFKTFLPIEKLISSRGPTLDVMGATQKCQININFH